MQICVVSGSHRKESQSEKVAYYIENVLKKIPGVSAVEVILLKNNPLPLLDDDFLDGKEERWKKLWSPYSEKLKKSAGIVMVCPEWHGMVPAGLKNFLLLCSHKELGHKAGLIVTVSSGLGGSYPVNELRTSGYKNTRICYIPEHIIIKNVNDMLNGEQPSNDYDRIIRNRIEYTSSLFIEYAKALNVVRESGKVDFKAWPNGM